MKEKFKTLFKNKNFEIIEVKSKCRNGKTRTNYYVDFGYRDCGAGRQVCTIDFETKTELKEFIKEHSIENLFTKNFLKTA